MREVKNVEELCNVFLSPIAAKLGDELISAQTSNRINEGHSIIPFVFASEIRWQG
jgi:hypothetical protein